MTEIQSDEAQETNRKKTGEWLAGQTFESLADTVSLVCAVSAYGTDIVLV